MIINCKELLEAAENGTPILNHLDELTEDAMKAIFFERVPICEGSISTKPLISPSKERVLTENLGRNEYVIYNGTCSRCGETVEFKLTRTDIVTHSFPFYRGINEYGSRCRKARPLYHESSGLTDFIAHGPYSSHELLVKKEGVKILCEACYNELIGEIEEATRDFLSGDVLGWANDCNNGLIPQEDLWKKEIFTLWKVHKETHKVVELKIDDRYYWLDEDFKNEVNETYGSTYTKERQYWREEDIPKRRSDTDSEFSFTGQNKPLEAGFSSFPIDDPFAANSDPIMDFNGFCATDEKSGWTLSSPTAQTREFIEKVCQPYDPSLLVYSNDVMNYILKAEGVDDGAVMRHNRFLLYSDYQRTPYWYHVSQRTKWAANFKCSKCGRNEDLQAHHLTYEHRGPDNLVAYVALANYSRQYNGKYNSTVSQWTKLMRNELSDQETGLIPSLIGEEILHNYLPVKGSYTALSCYYLTFINQEFARDQYEKLKKFFQQKRPIAGMKEYHDRRCFLGIDIDAGPIIMNLIPTGTAFAIGPITFFQEEEARTLFLKTAELAGSSVTWKGKRHYLLANVALVGEAITLAMRTATPWY